MEANQQLRFPLHPPLQPYFRRQRKRRGNLPKFGNPVHFQIRKGTVQIFRRENASWQTSASSCTSLSLIAEEVVEGLLAVTFDRNFEVISAAFCPPRTRGDAEGASETRSARWRATQSTAASGPGAGGASREKGRFPVEGIRQP